VVGNMTRTRIRKQPGLLMVERVVLILQQYIKALFGVGGRFALSRLMILHWIAEMQFGRGVAVGRSPTQLKRS
jgi:hypothetical protein